MLRGRVVLVVAFCLLGNACSSSRVVDATMSCAASDSTGAVRAVVREPSGQPVLNANVRAAVFEWSETDEHGRGCVKELKPGSVHFRVSRIGFHAESLTVRVTRGIVTDVAVTLRRMAPPCCRLEGVWKIVFDMERPSAMHEHPAARSVEGIVVFSPRLPAPIRWAKTLDDPVIRYEYGHTSVNFSPLFGGLVARDVSTTIIGPGGETLFREVLGIVPAGDSVELGFIPRMSHGSMWLHCRIAHDTIVGRWIQSAYCCGAQDRFEMHRIQSSPQSTSLVESGLEAYAREERMALAADSAYQRRIGWIRLGVYDEAVRHYVKANFWLASAAHDSVPSLATLESAANSGWGNYREMEPGDYDTSLSEFSCGRHMYLADPAYVRKNGLAFPLTVRTGQRVDREVRIDSRRIKTRSYYEFEIRCGAR